MSKDSLDEELYITTKKEEDKPIPLWGRILVAVAALIVVKSCIYVVS